MTSLDHVRIIAHPKMTPDQLFSFYEENNICEVGYGKEKASKVLAHSSLIVGAFEGDKLVGIARAMFDGLAGAIMEFCVATEYQGDNLKYGNGSLIEDDRSGLGKKLGKVFIDELVHMGATFITVYIVQDCEERFYESIGFEYNTGHLVYYIERRPYVIGVQDTTGNP